MQGLRIPDITAVLEIFLLSGRGNNNFYCCGIQINKNTIDGACLRAIKRSNLVLLHVVGVVHVMAHRCQDIREHFFSNISLINANYICLDARKEYSIRQRLKNLIMMQPRIGQELINPTFLHSGGYMPCPS